MFRKIYEWLTTGRNQGGSEWADDVGHVIEGAVIFSVAYALYCLSPVLPLALCVSLFFVGREQGQYQAKLKKELKLKSIMPIWYKGYFPFEWGKDGFVDWLVPTVLAFLVVMWIM